MNNHAVSDLIGCSLQRWYRSVAEWSGPSGGTAEGCIECRASDFAAFDRLGQWPHELVHCLVDTLEQATRHLAISLHEDQHGSIQGNHTRAPCSHCVDDARSTVAAAAADHTRDLIDVVTECVLPRLAVYVELNADLVISAVTHGDWD
ncbi:hypothetical protein [Rhodoglobus vestalii]|uniref:hypothetical protein n=1 Tax=Rhodoglobus vestalii TaxID=193384 RepID=UPI001151077B|nr:hypothetical protein [Rhodoglobus vestalii]